MASIQEAIASLGQRVLYGIEGVIARRLWSESSLSDSKGKKPSKDWEMWLPGLYPNPCHLASGWIYIVPIIMVPGHGTDHCVALRHAIQNLIDQGLVNLGQPSITTNPLQAHSTHVVPQPPGDIHHIDFLEDDNIHMLSWNDRLPKPIVLDDGYEVDTVGYQTSTSFSLISNWGPSIPFILWLEDDDSKMRDILIVTHNGKVAQPSPLVARPFDGAVSHEEVLRIPTSFNRLLGRPWIHRIEAIPYSIHQNVKFIHDRQHGPIEFVATADHSTPFGLRFVPIEVDYRHMARPHRERVRAHLTCTPFDYPGHPYTMSLAYYFINGSEVHPYVEDFGIMTDINGVDELQYQFHHLQLGNETSSAPHEIADCGVVIELTEVIDGVVPHVEYRDEMDMMSMSHIAEMVQLELTSQLDLFGVFVMESRELNIGSPLSTDERNRLIHLLKSYLDVFTWSYKDMLGLDSSIIQEHLPILLHARPIKQKLRRLYPHWSLRVKEEIRKQLNVGFISMVEYPKWLANFTPVPKEDGKARFCVDFKDLNKVNPKDDFPLLHIDLLVDSTVGHLMLSFMDGFFGYNQILMALEDMEKTVFITE
uniref:Transposon Ty3-I Gag-Pol polyprotein n=1 Tax=Vitis vinifera TaxID=29760 RepID=A5BDM2_VITVI|nr:hypothetical protein VITISV_003179 [Vitis vinifera]